MANPAEWIQVKLRRTTHQKLREWCERTLAVIVQQGRNDIPFSPENGIGLDVAIATLLARDEAHRGRGRKASKGRAERNRPKYEG